MESKLTLFATPNCKNAKKIKIFDPDDVIFFACRETQTKHIAFGNSVMKNKDVLYKTHCFPDIRI